MDLVEEFITGRPASREPTRMLATVMFTDIVDSTGRAATLGDHAWRGLLDRHHELVRARLERFRGREIKTTGDGFLATFDGPARAVACAAEVVSSAEDLELAIRVDLHAGECEIIDGDIGGIAVHIGARVAALARPRRFWSPEPSRTWLSAPSFSSTTAAPTPYGACLASGGSTRCATGSSAAAGSCFSLHPMH